MTEWTKACSGGDCIEIGVDDIGKLWLRSTVDPEAEFRVTREELARFLAGVKDGRFDHLVQETP